MAAMAAWLRQMAAALAGWPKAKSSGGWRRKHNSQQSAVCIKLRCRESWLAKKMRRRKPRRNRMAACERRRRRWLAAYGVKLAWRQSICGGAGSVSL